MTKICLQCGESFEASGKNHLYCTKICQKLSHKPKFKSWSDKYRVHKPEKQIIRSAKYRANKRGIAFDITDVDVEFPTHCPVFGIPLVMNLNSGPGGKQNSYSLDRIYPEKGYVKGNVQIISHLANSMKSAATPEQLVMFADWVYKTYKENK